MISIETLAEFFGWCTVLNIGIYMLTVGAVTLFRDRAYRINAKLFSLGEDVVARVSFQYIGAYKLAITILCFVPYLALKIMS